MKKREGGGFTLIELLVVIAVLAVLAAGVITAINPGKRIRQANDAKIKNDIGQIATGMQSFFTTSQYYPANVLALKTSGDLKTEPLQPINGNVYNVNTSGDCAASPFPLCEVAVSAALNDPKTIGNLWCWTSFSGKACETLAAGCVAVSGAVCVP